MRFANVCRLTAAALVGAVLACEEEQIAFPLPEAEVEEFQAALTGANEVPPVTTSATGLAEFAVVLDTFLTYRLAVGAIDSPVTAHMHPGAAGSEQETVTLLILLSTDTTRRAGINGQVAASQLKASQLTRIPASYGANAVARFDSLVSLMRAGNVYVHVHTRANRDGAIRGQIQPR